MWTRQGKSKNGICETWRSNQSISKKLSRKPKKGMLKKLGLANADENMNRNKQEKMMSYKCPASDLETNVSCKKKKKSTLPKMGTNGMDHHASVPRKLRSAMRWRNLESVSASKRLNQSKTGTESFNIDLVNKENQELDANAIVNEFISKDEKEVAETLYGLADMFTDSDSTHKKTYEPFLSDGKVTTKVDSLEPKQNDEEPVQQQDHNQCSLTGLKQSRSVNVSDAQSVSTKPTLLNLLSSTKVPHWMAQAQAASPTNNVSLLSEPLRVRTRKLKICASHVYICRLIKALKTSKSTNPVALNQTEERSLEMSQCSLPDPVTTMVAPSKRYQNPHLIDLHKTHNPKPVQENMTQLGLELYATHTTQKQVTYVTVNEQNYDLVSLASSGAAQTHLPFPQYPISASYNSPQMQQTSPYQATRFQTAYNTNHHQQQFQKRLCAAQYRPQTSRITVSPLSNQYNKSSLSLNLTSLQPTHVASSPRYINNVSQQQHLLMAATAAMSMSHHHNNNHSHLFTKTQEHHCNYSATSGREDVLLYS